MKCLNEENIANKVSNGEDTPTHSLSPALEMEQTASAESNSESSNTITVGAGIHSATKLLTQEQHNGEKHHRVLIMEEAAPSRQMRVQ